MKWIDLAQDDRWLPLVDAVMNLRVPKNLCHFLAQSSSTSPRHLIVWYTGLLYKLHTRYFQVKYNSSYSNCHEVLSGVPQGSVLGPLLYLILTANLPTTYHATFADDTGLLAVRVDPIVTSQQL